MASTPNIHSAYEVYIGSRKIRAASGINLRECHSNSLELLEKSMGTSLNTSQMTTGVTDEDNIYVKTLIRPKVSKLSQRLTKVHSYLGLHGISHLMCSP